MKSPSTFTQDSALDFQVPILSKALVFVGFETSIPVNFFQFASAQGRKDYLSFKDGASAIDYLHRLSSVQHQLPPVAIICQLAFLEADQFHFSNYIASDPSTKFVPLIALNEAGTIVDKTTILRNGLDDCYSTPVSWEKIEHRVSFLNQYKPRFSNQAQMLQEEPYHFQIPLGKRLFDIMSATLLLFLSMPLWLLTAIAIKLESKGPVLYCSKRVGAGYKKFDFLKFRSMSLHADKMLDEYRYLNQYADGSSFVKISNDPRITKVGKFIRKYSIDELPQLLNVLRGDMSIVGNRPLPVYEAETLTQSGWCNRFLAPAGITGLWQVTKRGKADMSHEERISLDVRYAEDYSFWVDLKILFKTPFAIIQKEHV